MTALPAVVTIGDLATSASINATALFEAAMTAGGVGTSIQVPLSQLVTSIMSALPPLGVWPVTAGGTGTATITAFGVPYGQGTTQIGVTAAGTTGWALVGNGSSLAPTFQQVNLTAGVTAVLGVPFGGTNTSTLTAFGVTFGNGTSTLGITAAGTSAWVLTGNGSASAPTFQQVNLTAGVTAVLGVPFGGTNTSILTAFGVVYGNGSSTVGITSAGTASLPLVGNGTTSAPSFQVLPFAGISSSALATESQAESSVSSSFLMTPLGVSQSRIANAQQFGRNIVGRNGGFEVVQRLGVNSGTTVAILASSVSYQADGWFLQTGANQSSTFTRATGIVAGSQFAGQYQRVQTATGTTIMYVGFPLDTDELDKLKGNSVVLSLTAAAGSHWSPASGNFTAALLVGTGAGGPAKRGATAYTGEISVIGTTLALASTNAAVRFVTAPSAVISTSITQAELQFSYLPVGGAGTSDLVKFDDVQVEMVPASITSQIVPIFERSDFVWDQHRCQRFLAVYNAPSAGANAMVFGGSYVATSAVYVYPLKVSTRTSITGMTVSAPAHFSLSNGTTLSTNATTVAFNSGNTECVGFIGTITTANFTPGQWSFMNSQNATAQILFTGAEI